MLNSLQAQNAALRQLVVIHDRLGALVLQGADVAVITRTLADLVGRRVLLLDALLQVIVMEVPAHVGRSDGMAESFRWAPRDGYVRAVLATLARERRPLRVPPMAHFGVNASCVLAPVAVGDEMLGYLAILAEWDEGRPEDLDLQIVQHAATVYALSMMRERMAADVARQLKDELFEGLLLGRAQDEQVAHERALRVGYDTRVAYRVLALVVAGNSEDTDTDRRPELVAQRKRLLESLAELCARTSPDALVTVRGDELVVLVPSTTDAREMGSAAARQAAALLPTWGVSIGIGSVCDKASAIARSYAQARRALEASHRFGNQGPVVAFEDLGLYRLLFHVADATELHGFVDQVLGSLIEYDQRHGTDFVRTLDTFLANNGNLQASARELNLHVNSVTYRVQRIASISRLDLAQSEARLLAQVALKILYGVGSSPVHSARKQIP